MSIGPAWFALVDYAPVVEGFEANLNAFPSLAAALAIAVVVTMIHKQEPRR